jgi:hypothetical protein
MIDVKDAKSIPGRRNDEASDCVVNESPAPEYRSAIADTDAETDLVKQFRQSLAKVRFALAVGTKPVQTRHQPND